VIEAEDDGDWNRDSEGQAVIVHLVPGSDRSGSSCPSPCASWMMSLIFVPFGLLFLYTALECVPDLGY
jgi:hypothetical protein